MSKAAPAAGNSAANTFKDLNIIPELFQIDKSNVLIWNGINKKLEKRSILGSNISFD